MADYPRLTIHQFTRRPPMDLNVFLTVTRRRHTSLASMHVHTQDAESHRRPEQATSDAAPKRKRRDCDNHRRREEARAKRRKERDAVKQQRIQALETRLREIQAEREQLKAEEKEIIKKKDALYVKKQELADSRRKMMAVMRTSPSSLQTPPPMKRLSHEYDRKGEGQRSIERTPQHHPSSLPPSSPFTTPPPRHQSPEKVTSRSASFTPSSRPTSPIDCYTTPPPPRARNRHDLPPHLRHQNNRVDDTKEEDEITGLA